jgi:hypothetical protein
VVVQGTLDLRTAAALTDLTPLRQLTRIDGDLLVGAGDLQTLDGLEALTLVRGSVVVDTGRTLDEVVLPALVEADAITVSGGAGRVIGLPSLVSTGVVSLDSVGMEVVDLGALLSASVVVSEAPLLTGLDLPALVSADALLLQQLGSLVSLSLPALQELGSLRLEGTALTELPLFEAEIDAVRLIDDPELARVDALALWAPRVVELRGSPRVQEVPALGEVEQLTLEGAALSDLGAVRVTQRLELTGVPLLDAGGIEVDAVLQDVTVSGLERSPDLRFLSGLQEVVGLLRIEGNGALVELSGLESLQHTCETLAPGLVPTPPFQCQGGLEVLSNPALADVSALIGLESGGGRFVDNASLCDLGLEAFLLEHPCEVCGWNMESNDGC